MWSGAGGVAKEFNMKAVAVAVTVLLAEVDEGVVASADDAGFDSLGHEEDLGGGNGDVEFTGKFGQFVHVPGGGHDEFELEGVVCDPGIEDVEVEAGFVVAPGPGVAEFFRIGGGVGQFGTQGGEVAGDSFRSDGACSFDGNVLTVGLEQGQELGEFLSDHGFASGHHHVTGPELHDPGSDIFHGHLGSGRVPGCVFGVAPGAAEVASGGADEDRGHPGEFTFALDRVENLRDQHLQVQVEEAGAAGRGSVSWYSVGSGIPAI